MLCEDPSCNLTISAEETKVLSIKEEHSIRNKIVTEDHVLEG